MVICDIRGCSLGAFYDAMSEMGKMIDINKPNYFDSMDRWEQVIYELSRTLMDR